MKKIYDRLLEYFPRHARKLLLIDIPADILLAEDSFWLSKKLIR